MASLRIALFALFCILGSIEANDGIVTTIPSVNIMRGTNGSLPCEVKQKSIAVAWWKKSSSSENIIAYIETFPVFGEKGGPGYDDGSFDITDDYSLIIRRARLQDGGQYFCQMSDFETGKLFRDETKVTVYVPAKEPFPIIDNCINNTADQPESDCIINTTQSYVDLTCHVDRYFPSFDVYFIYQSRRLDNSDNKEWENSDGTWGKSVTIRVTNSSSLYECVAIGIGVGGNQTQRSVPAMVVVTTLDAPISAAPDVSKESVPIVIIATDKGISLSLSLSLPVSENMEKKRNPLTFVPLALILVILSIFTIVYVRKRRRKREYTAVPDDVALEDMPENEQGDERPTDTDGAPDHEVHVETTDFADETEAGSSGPVDEQQGASFEGHDLPETETDALLLFSTVVDDEITFLNECSDISDDAVFWHLEDLVSLTRNFTIRTTVANYLTVRGFCSFLLKFWSALNEIGYFYDGGECHEDENMEEVQERGDEKEEADGEGEREEEVEGGGMGEEEKAEEVVVVEEEEEEEEKEEGEKEKVKEVKEKKGELTKDSKEGKQELELEEKTGQEKGEVNIEDERKNEGKRKDTFEKHTKYLIQKEKMVQNYAKLMSCYVTFTDFSSEMCREIVDCGFLDILFTTLEVARLPEEIIANTVFVISNCLRMMPERGSRYEDKLDILLESREKLNFQHQLCVNFMISYIFMKSDTRKMVLSESSVKLLLNLSTGALESGDRRFEGFSLDELVQGIRHLTVNDDNKRLIADAGGLELLQRVLMDEGSSVTEKQNSAFGIWQFAFIDEIKAIMGYSDQLLDELASIKFETTDELLKYACTGALLEISEGFTTIVVENDDRHVVISYHKSSIDIVRKIKDSLMRHDYVTWMDEENYSGNNLEATAEAVQQASVVLVCMSLKYRTSRSCRTEASYASRLQKDTVLINVEEGYSPDEWLADLVQGRAHYSMYTDEKIDENMEDLVKELGSRGKGKESKQPMTSEEETETMTSQQPLLSEDQS